MHKLVLVNGCFDILTFAHVRLLNFAKSLGNHLVVGINSDFSVQKLKGLNRPINNQTERREVLLGLKAVNEVEIFEENDAHELLLRIKPDLWVKGSEYTIDKLTEEERAAMTLIKCELALFPKIEGISTTNIIKKINGNLL